MRFVDSVADKLFMRFEKPLRKSLFFFERIIFLLQRLCFKLDPVLQSGIERLQGLFLFVNRLRHFVRVP